MFTPKKDIFKPKLCEQKSRFFKCLVRGQAEAGYPVGGGDRLPQEDKSCGFCLLFFDADGTVV